MRRQVLAAFDVGLAEPVKPLMVMSRSNQKMVSWVGSEGFAGQVFIDSSEARDALGGAVLFGFELGALQAVDLGLHDSLVG